MPPAVQFQRVNRTYNVVPPSLIKQAPLYFCSASAPICLFVSSPKTPNWRWKMVTPQDLSCLCCFPQMIGNYYIYLLCLVQGIAGLANLHHKFPWLWSPLHSHFHWWIRRLHHETEFAPHLTRGQHICCSWLSKHCHCGARTKRTLPTFGVFLGDDWECTSGFSLRPPVNKWGMFLLPCSSDGWVLHEYETGIRSNMIHHNWFHGISQDWWSFHLWQGFFPRHKHHWTQYSRINYSWICDKRFLSSINLWTSGMMYWPWWSLVPCYTN